MDFFVGNLRLERRKELPTTVWQILDDSEIFK